MMSRHFDGELRMLNGLGTGLGLGVGTDGNGSGSGSGSVVNNNSGVLGGQMNDQHYKTILQLLVGVYDADEPVAVAHTHPLPIHSHPANPIINTTTTANNIVKVSNTVAVGRTE